MMALNDGIDIAGRSTHIECERESGAPIYREINGYICVLRFRVEKCESSQNIGFIK